MNMYSYYSQITQKHISEKFPGEIPGIFRVAFRVALSRKIVHICVSIFFSNEINYNLKSSVYQLILTNAVKSTNL